MIWPIALFAIAAVGGVVMAIMRLSGRELPPMGLAVVHGLFAAGGLVALIVALMTYGFTLVSIVALIGFVGAALGGFYLFGLHMKRRALPIPAVLIHGGFAVLSFLVLLVGVYVLRP